VKTLNNEASIHEKFRSAATIEDKFWGTKIFVPAPSSSLLTPMMRRE
jgi:hypothetical protein